MIEYAAFLSDRRVVATNVFSFLTSLKNLHDILSLEHTEINIENGLLSFKLDEEHKGELEMTIFLSEDEGLLYQFHLDISSGGEETEVLLLSSRISFIEGFFYSESKLGEDYGKLSYWKEKLGDFYRHYGNTPSDEGHFLCHYFRILEKQKIQRNLSSPFVLPGEYISAYHDRYSKYEHTLENAQKTNNEIDFIEDTMVDNPRDIS